ncbi:hypothetical protein K2173_019551 [Erythroxylum novogranatense]|uniref:acylphosphatase n=1 Tax=Erythroxylum novogranatense TaxID=1862640 RepID=A0AAV8UE82_9ROSI|nr:hypothetical protein K2173_019551 [Erythroxylum novogranatense]
MALSSMNLRPSLCHRRFLISLANIREQSILIVNTFYNNPSICSRFLTRYRAYTLQSCRSFRSDSLLTYSPLRSSMSSVTNPHAAPHSSTESSSTKTVRVMIKGRVQGVFYRNWTIENATQLGLKGWVRNRRDGSVEALFSGDSDKVLEMEQRCRRGPPDALVTGLQAFPSDDDPGNGFERRPTV